MKQCSSLIYCLFRRGATAPKQRCHIDDWPGNKVLTTDFTGMKRHQLQRLVIGKQFGKQEDLIITSIYFQLEEMNQIILFMACRKITG